jgi:hypothetical protein
MARKISLPMRQDEVDEYVKWAEEQPVRVIGVGPDAEIVTNDKGAKQSKVNHRLDLIPADAVFRMGETLKIGAERYAEWNWTGIPTTDHINHALIHLYAWLAGDTQDDHLGHAITRIAFAIHTDAHGED